MKFDLRFDPETHTYYIDGVLVPGVTAVLKEAGFIDYSFVDPQTRECAMEAGADLHEATEMFDRDILDVSDLQGEIKGEIDAYENFCKKHKARFELCEAVIGNPTGTKYATIIDRYGSVDDRKTLVSIKTGAACYWHGIQLQLEREALRHTFGIVVSRAIAVYLKPSGKFRIVNYMKWAGADYSAGIAAVIIYNRKRLKLS